MIISMDTEKLFSQVQYLHIIKPHMKRGIMKQLFLNLMSGNYAKSIASIKFNRETLKVFPFR